MSIQIIVEPDASNDEVKRYLTSATYYDNRKSVDVPTFNYRVVDKRKKSGKYYKNFILVDPSRFLRRLKQTLDSSTYEHLYDGVESSEKLLSMWEEWIVHVFNMDPVCTTPDTPSLELKAFEMSRRNT